MNPSPASQTLRTGNDNASVLVKTAREESAIAVPGEHTLVGHAKLRGPVGRTVSLKNLLHLQSYSFISDIDCSAAQQRVDSSDSEDETEYQYQSGEHVDAMNSIGNADRSAKLLLSPKSTMIRGLEHSASSRIRGFSNLSNINEVTQYRSTRMSHGGNAQPPVSGASVGYNGSTRNASSVLSITNDDAIEDLLSPKQKQPKDSNVLAVSGALPAAMKRSVWSVKDYSIGKQLHKGYASRVFSAQCKASGLKVVLKVYKLEKMDDLQRCQLFRETRIHSELQHHNIAQFYCAFKVSLSGS